MDKQMTPAPTPGVPTPKQRLFVHLILQGKSTVEAHRLAGYKGSPHAAYELRSKLRAEIAAEAAARGVSADGVSADIAAMDELPVDVPEKGLSVDQKLKLIGLKHKVLSDRKEAGRDLAEFVIGKRPVEVVDAEVVAPETGVPPPKATGEGGGV